MKLIRIMVDGIAPALKTGEWYIVNDVSARDIIASVSNDSSKYEMQEFLSKYNGYDGSDLNGKTLMTIRTGGAGDILFKTTAIKHTKEKYPDCKVIACCAPKYLGLLEDNPHIDELIGMPIPLKKMIDSDYHLIFENIIENNIEATKKNAYDLFLERFHIDPAKIKAEDKLPVVIVNEDSVNKIVVKEPWLINDDKLNIAIHLRTSAPLRTFDQKKLFIVAKRLKKQYRCNVILLCSPMELSDVMSNVNYFDFEPSDFHFSPSFTDGWRDVIALIHLCDVVIAGDSSIAHIAGGLKKPLLALYGPFPSEMRTKYYTNTIALDAKAPCAPCFLPNQRIITKREVVNNISRVNVGDEVLTHKGRFMPVTDIIQREVESCEVGVVYFEDSKNLLKATMDHPVFCAYTEEKDKDPDKHDVLTLNQIDGIIQEGGKVCVKYFDYDVVLNLDFMKISRTLDVMRQQGDDSIFNYDGGDETISTKIDNIAIPNKLEMCLELMKFFGIYISSGRSVYVSRNKGEFRKYSVNIVAENDDVKDEATQLIKHLFGLDDKVFKFKYNKTGKSVIIVECDILARFLDRLFKNRMIPRFLFGHDREDVQAFLAGIWLGTSGNPLLRKEVVIESANRRYIYSLAIMLRRVGYMVDIENLPYAKYKITLINDNPIDATGGIFLNVSKIVRKIYDGSVYNLEVKEDESYVAHMFVVHNCFTHGHEPCIKGIPSPCFQLIRIEDIIDTFSLLCKRNGLEYE